MSASDFIDEIIGDRLGGSKSSLIFTPQNIVSDMCDLLFIKHDKEYEYIGGSENNPLRLDSTFLAFADKSGRFPVELFKRLMNTKLLKDVYPDESERRNHILNNMIYVYSLSNESVLLARRLLYGSIVSRYNKNINIINDIDLVATCKSNPTNIENVANTIAKYLGFKNSNGDLIMRFDCAIGNPPYNNDMYLEFVTLGHKLAKQYDVWITPAKWQAKGGKENKAFRRDIVPYMREIVYYPDCIELFGISENSGITYYIVTKEVHDEKDIINKAYYQPLVNSEIKRTLNEDDTLWNIGSQILNKINSKNEDKFKLNIIDEYNRKEYTICASKQWCGSRVSSGAWDMQTSSIKPSAIGKGGCIFNPAGNIKVIGKIVGLRKGEHDDSGSSVYIFTSDSKDECNSFYSWITTKLVSFLILINLKGSIIMNDTTLKYIPDPGQFDHIFTNDEMYARYKLTDDEINIIESVIK